MPPPHPSRNPKQRIAVPSRGAGAARAAGHRAVGCVAGWSSAVTCPSRRWTEQSAR